MTASLGAVVAVFAILAFAISHSVFFWFYASRDAERATERKVALLRLARAALRARGRDAAAAELDAYVARRGAAAARAAPSGAAEAREAHNLRLIGLWVGPVVTALCAGLLGLVAYNARTDRHLTYAHWIGLLLALFGYVPELLLFRFVTDPYVLIGDAETLALALGAGDGVGTAAADPESRQDKQ